MNVAAYGQSLGEIARENREKQKAQESSAAPPKVITNRDLGEGPDGSPEAREEQLAAASKFNRRSAEMDRRSEQELLQGQRAGGQWKRQILEQESRVASLQARIDQINAALRLGGASGQAPYNRYQARQLERVAEMQLQLDEQKRRLDQMQDGARRAGMHTAVYDP